MKDQKRNKNIAVLSETLWILNKWSVLEYFERKCGHPIPDECIPLIERSFRIGSVLMEKALRKDVKS